MAVSDSGFRGIIKEDVRSYDDQFCECNEDGIMQCSPLPQRVTNIKGTS